MDPNELEENINERNEMMAMENENKNEQRDIEKARKDSAILGLMKSAVCPDEESRKTWTRIKLKCL